MCVRVLMECGHVRLRYAGYMRLMYVCGNVCVNNCIAARGVVMHVAMMRGIV